MFSWILECDGRGRAQGGGREWLGVLTKLKERSEKMGDENGDRETKCNSFGNGREKFWVGLGYYIPETNVVKVVT